jgi:hypothetical protein
MKLTFDVSQKDKYKRKWKNEVKGMGTNAQWGKELLVSIINELDNRDRPDLNYIEKKVHSFERFLKDIELAEERAKNKSRRVI